MNTRKALRDLASFRGWEPFDGPGNIVRGDGYFERSMWDDHGVDSTSELEEKLRDDLGEDDLEECARRMLG